MKNPSVCGEIEYESESGLVHSDLCPPEHNPAGILEDSYRELLHVCLDEWLDKSGGTGRFFVGDSKTWKFVPEDKLIPALTVLLDVDGI
jgi:hypothetical protein|tara:strand:- start:1882 stop:2148 length:267 start_codon:yes stop_codon:yes gene_type:complete